MGLLDWLKGGKQADEPRARESQDERLGARREETESAPGGPTEPAGAGIDRPDDEAARGPGVS